VFWVHLVCGVVTGLVILMMSVSGVLLTYERQILEWADNRSHPAIDTSAGPRESIDSLIAEAQVQDPAFRAASIVISNDSRRAVVLSTGRGGGSRLVDPHSGTVLGEGATALRSFFSSVTGWHRWFNADRESRGPWRALTAVSNLAFLFLLLSGLYLWLPRVFRWPALRMHLWFNPKAQNAKARDYNWHHVFGFWTAIPLLVIVYTATVFYFDWSNDLLYRAFGDEPPQRATPAAVAHHGGGHRSGDPQSADGALAFDQLMTYAMQQVHDWQRISMDLPEDGARTVRFTIDRGTGGQPQHRHALVLEAATGRVSSWEPFESQSPGRRARSWVRFLHTGEAFGIAGQTIAGLVSATTVLMVWTGLALAWRRLVTPVLRRTRKQ